MGDEGMHVFEWWCGEYRPLEELIAEMDEVKKNNGEQFDKFKFRDNEVFRQYTMELKLG